MGGLKSPLISDKGYVCIRGMVAVYLKAHGYDGLWNTECACKLSDLFPCGTEYLDCKAGHYMPCPDDCGEHNFHIGEKETH